MISYLFVLLMMVIGGVIGFLADSWGHKIGKKRLSFMGLRPRHTATLVTVGAGVVIPLLTVVIVAMLSSDVRAWILKGQWAIREAKQLQGRVDDLTITQKTVEERIREKTALSERLDRELKAREAQVKTLEAGVERNKKAASQALAKVVGLAGRLSLIGKQLDEKRRELTAAQGRVAAARKEYHTLTQSYNVLQADLKAAYDKYDQQEKDKDALQATVDKLWKGVAELLSKGVGSLTSSPHTP